MPLSLWSLWRCARVFTQPDGKTHFFMKNTPYFLHIVAILLSAQPSFGQNQPLLASASQTIETAALSNQQASFPNLGNYLDDNLEYPELALKNAVEGTVTVEALIGETGEIKSLSLYQGIGFGCDETVMKLVSNMPNWQPAVKNGQQVPQKVFIRVRFKLE